MAEKSKTHSDFYPLIRQSVTDFDKSQLAEDDGHIEEYASSSPITAELFSATRSKKFLGTHFVNHFIGALLEKDSMWICGWNIKKKNNRNDEVLWHVKTPTFEVLQEKTKKNPKANVPTIMVSFKSKILFTKKGSGEIYSFNTETQTFQTMFHDVNFQIDAMCCNDDYLYIFQKKRPDVIQILDSRFQSVGFIPTEFKDNFIGCEVDLCTTTIRTSASTQEHSSTELEAKHQHMCIFSISGNPAPPVLFLSITYPFVRAVNEAGVAWHVDSETCPELGISFNPRSVSASASGDVFIADYSSDRIWRLAQDGADIQILLDKKDGIIKPTWVHSEKKGGQLTVINEDGHEIRNYNLIQLLTASEKELLTQAYSDACAKGEVSTYRAQVAVWGQSKAGKTSFIQGLLNEPRSPSLRYMKETKGTKTYLISSKFNKHTQKTAEWTDSTRDSSKLETEFRNEVLCHIQSTQHKDHPREEIQTPQQSHTSLASASVQLHEEFQEEQRSILKPEKRKINRPKVNNETLLFLHRNTQGIQIKDDSIPYSINLWEYGDHNELIAMNHLFPNAEALVLYVMDISQDLFSPEKQHREEEKTFGKSKSPADILNYWLNSVHLAAKKRNTEPSITLVLTHTDMITAEQPDQYIKSYIKAILDMVDGKPYATYISQENIIAVDNLQDAFEDFRNKLFRRIMMHSNWGLKRPIKWLRLEAELLRRTNHAREYAYNKKKSFLGISKVKELASGFGMDDHEVESFLEFHHVLGDFLCWPPSKFENIVIVHPQWLLDSFTRVLNLQDYKLFKKPRQSSEAIVSEEKLHMVCARNEVQLLTNLMINFDFILPLHSDSDQKELYLIPCMLPPDESYIYEAELTYSSIYRPYIGDVLPMEMFLTLLSVCTKQSNWKLNFSGHLSRYHASFDVTMGTHLVLTQKKNNTIQVSTWISVQELDEEHASSDKMRTFIFNIHKDVSKKMEILGLTHDTVFQILCPHWRPSDEYLCLVEMEEKIEPTLDNFLFYPVTTRCAIHKKILEPFLFLSTGELWIVKVDTNTDSEDAAERMDTGTCKECKVIPLADMVFSFLQARLDIMRIIRGKSCAIQGIDSDTLLYIPDGVYAALLGNIHTDPTKFQHHIPTNDCLVSPICEYHLQPFLGRSLPKDIKYKLRVPHTVRDIYQAQKNIRIRCGDIHDGALLPVHKLEKDKYEIDEKYVKIYTSHFSGYIVTAEGINCCSKSVNVLLFGSLVNNMEMGPSVTDKVYLSSIHSQIKDYKAALQKEEKMCTMSLDLLTKTEISLSKEEYNATKSRIEFKLEPIDPKKWTKLRDDMHLYIVKPLDEALTFESGHICKTRPQEIVRFYMQSAESPEFFRGVMDTNVTVVKAIPDDDNNNTVKTASYPIMVELKCCTTGGSQGVEPIVGDEKDLTMRDFSRLARKIQMDNMKMIAREQLEIDDTDIDNITADCRDKTYEFNYEILKKWWKRSHENNRTKLASLLYEAVDDELLDSDLVVKVLGVPPSG